MTAAPHCRIRAGVFGDAAGYGVVVEVNGVAYRSAERHGEPADALRHYLRTVRPVLDMLLAHIAAVGGTYTQRLRALDLEEGERDESTDY